MQLFVIHFANYLIPPTGKKTYNRLLLKKNIYEKLKRKDLLFV